VLSRPADTTSGVANQPQHDMTSFGKAAIAMKVGMIVGSTRPNRFADMPVQWLAEGGSARPDLRLTVLDLRDYPLPFFNEPASPVNTAASTQQPNGVGEYVGLFRVDGTQLVDRL
jgi:NADPH-dependent FMN reductase